MESRITRTHRPSNREKLQQAHALILDVSHDEFIGPIEFEHLTQALDSLDECSKFPLNEAEAFERHQLAIGYGIRARARKGFVSDKELEHDGRAPWER